MNRSEATGNRSEAIRRIRETGIMPVIRVGSADEAMRAIDAVAAGGVDVVEITMTVPGALRAIERAAERYGSEVLVGAGTVLDAETARACLLAGARFVVAPSLDLRTIEMCRRYSAPVLPGALTPTEIVAAWQAGADMVKVFPCGALGGAKYLRSLKGPLPQIEMLPTGGVSLETAADFIRAGASALGVGSELVNSAALGRGEDKQITERARRFVEVIREARQSVQSEKCKMQS